MPLECLIIPTINFIVTATAGAIVNRISEDINKKLCGMYEHYFTAVDPPIHNSEGKRSESFIIVDHEEWFDVAPHSENHAPHLIALESPHQSSGLTLHCDYITPIY